MRTNFVKQGLLFVLFVLIQGLVLKNVVLFNTSFCFLYVLFLLSINIDIEPIPAIMLGFFMGLSVDIFYNSGAIHASSSVFLMYFRSKWLNLITPQGGYDMGARPGVHLNGLQWYLGYIFPLILIHHILLFTIEASNFDIIWFTLKNAVTSTIFTSLIIILVQYIFYKR